MLFSRSIDAKTGGANREGMRTMDWPTSADLMLQAVPALIVALSVAAAALQFLLTVRW